MGKLFEALGLKRKIAAFLNAIGGVIAAKPELLFLVPYLNYIAAFFGLAGIAHATKAGTLLDHKTLTVSAFFSILLGIVSATPALHPYIGIVTLLASLFGVVGSATGKVAAKVAVKKKS